MVHLHFLALYFFPFFFPSSPFVYFLPLSRYSPQSHLPLVSEIRLAEGRESDGCIWCSSRSVLFLLLFVSCLMFSAFFLSSRFLKSSCECNAKQISKQTTHRLVSLECVPRFYTTLSPLFSTINTQYAPTQPALHYLAYQSVH